MIIILFIFVMMILTLIWMFLGYPVVLFVINKIKSNPVDKTPQTLNVTVLVCTYQEANVIERRLENILQSDYPVEQMEILIVDSSSPDGTCDVVDRFCATHPLAPIRLICEDNRRGKVSAINIGLSSAHGDIIILTDAPALFWPDTIRFVIENFNDPKVGVTTGNFVDFPNGVETSSQKTDQLLFRYRNLLRHLESEVDSTPWLSGELLAVRKSLLPAIPSEVIIDDCYIALYIRSLGYRVISDSRAKYAEKRSKTYREMIIQKVKSIAGEISEVIRFRNMCFNKRYGVYGWLVYPTKIVLMLHLSPVILLLVLVSGLILLINWIGVEYFLILTGLSMIIILVLFFYNEGRLLHPFLAIILAQWIILKGIYLYIKGGNNAAWEQVRSTRE